MASARRPLVHINGDIKELPTGDSVAGVTPGLPVGGTINQGLLKNSANDYDVSWTQLIKGSGAITTIAIVASLPGTPDANTLYIVTG